MAFQMHIFSFIPLLIILNCESAPSTWIAKNIRGYIHYPLFGPYNYSDPKLEVIFDYDQISVPKSSRAEIECCGYAVKNPSTVPCDRSNWRNQKTSQIRPFVNVYFSVPSEIDRYFCRVRLVDDHGVIRGPWTDYGPISIDPGSVIHPKPGLLVCQALMYPLENFNGYAMDRAMHVDAANVPDEKVSAQFNPYRNCYLGFWALEDIPKAYHSTPFCFDWIGQWEYRADESNQNCLSKYDGLFVTTPKEIKYSLSCLESKILGLWCYPLKNLLLIVLESPMDKDSYRLISYDLGNNTIQTLVGSSSSTGTSCSRSLSHYWISIDWRRYWADRMNNDASIAFISDNALWSYDIRTDKCRSMHPLSKFGITQSNDIVQFDLDWSYFYWIDKSTYTLQTYSWSDNATGILDRLHTFEAEKDEINYNLSESLVESLKNIVAIMAYTPATRPFPFLYECIIPDLDIQVDTGNATSVSISVKKIWNHPRACPKMSEPWIRLKTSCSPDEPCRVLDDNYSGRNETFKTVLWNLTEGALHTVIVQASHSNHENLQQFYRQFNRTFRAEPRKSKHVLWWQYVLMIIAVLILFLSIASALFFRWYKKRRAIHEFLRQQRIDSSRLKLIGLLGEGEFGEVWLADYSKIVADASRSGKVQEHRVKVALKMRKINSNFQTTLVSADGFFQEAVALKFLRHPNIITVHGICTNYKNRPPILVMEYLNGGNCLDYVRAEKQHLTPADLNLICKDILKACCHLSKMRVVHKDIGARNILVRKNESTGKPGIAKLTDFGLARDIGNHEKGYWNNSEKDSMFHVHSTAPEGFVGKFTSRSDVWSFGIFAWELYALIELDNPVPYSEISQVSSEKILAYLKSGGRLRKPRYAKMDVYFLMGQCWAYDPQERPTFQQLLSTWKVLPDDHDPLISCLESGSEMVDGNVETTSDCDEGDSVISPENKAYKLPELDRPSEELQPNEDTSVLFKSFGYKAPSLLGCD